MKITAYNTFKGRLETMDVEITDKNTTWFDDCINNNDTYKISDTKNGLLISEFGYTYPVWIGRILNLTRVGQDWVVTVGQFSVVISTDCQVLQFLFEQIQGVEGKS